MNTTLASYVALFYAVGYGVLAGLGTDVLSAVWRLFFLRKTLAKNVLQFLGVMMVAALFFICLNFHNYGEIRLYLLLGYGATLYVEQKTLGKLFAKLADFVYNEIAKGLNRFKKTKVGQFVFR